MPTWVAILLSIAGNPNFPAYVADFENVLKEIESLASGAEAADTLRAQVENLIASVKSAGAGQPSNP